MRSIIVMLGAVCFAAPAAAQADYRNLDDDRPSRVEDAYPIERYAFELSGAYRWERATGGASRHLFVPELAYGILPGVEIGIKTPFLTDGGLAGLRALALFNLTTERPTLPGLSLRMDAGLPWGGEAGQGAALSLSALATRSFGRQRVHAVGAVALRRQDDPASAEALPVWKAGIALDRTLFRSSTLVVFDGLAEREVPGSPLRFTAGLGMRRQLTPTIVLDAGLSYGDAKGAASVFGLTAGFSHSFAFAALMPGGRR